MSTVEVLRDRITELEAERDRLNALGRRAIKLFKGYEATCEPGNVRWRSALNALFADSDNAGWSA